MKQSVKIKKSESVKIISKKQAINNDRMTTKNNNVVDMKISTASPKKTSFSKQKVVNTSSTVHKKSSTKDENNQKTQHFFDAAEKMQESVKNFNPFLKDSQSHFFKNFSQTGDMPKMDNEKMFSMYKKNMETLGEANKLAVDVMRQIAQIQGQFMRQTFEEIDHVVKENLAFKNVEPEVQLKKNTEHFQGAVKRAMDHSTQVSQIMLKSNQDLFKSVQNRFDEGMKEMQANFNKTKH